MHAHAGEDQSDSVQYIDNEHAHAFINVCKKFTGFP